MYVCLKFELNSTSLSKTDDVFLVSVVVAVVVVAVVAVVAAITGTLS